MGRRYKAAGTLLFLVLQLAVWNLALGQIPVGTTRMEA